MNAGFDETFNLRANALSIIYGNPAAINCKTRRHTPPADANLYSYLKRAFFISLVCVKMALILFFPRRQRLDKNWN
jgi:hypothetical protein